MSWDLEKKKAFTSTMGKRLKFAQGGAVRKLPRKNFDQGGTTLSGPSGVGSNSSATVNNHGLVGTLNNLLGLNNQFQAQGANIQQGTNTDQLNQAYQGAQGGLGQQQMLADQYSPGGMQGLASQQALTGQLQGVINGTGPNAAQTALNQNTAANVANQAALMAGQRGASSNVGLLARQNAMAGAMAQQQAVGQAATLQAQQQIAAQQQLQNLAASQVGQQAAAVQGVNSAQQNEQNILQSANNAANTNAVTMQSNINNVNAGVAGANQQQAGNMASTLGGIAGDVGGFIGFSHGGEVRPQMASGGPLSVAPTQAPLQAPGPWLASTPGGMSSAQSGQMAPLSSMVRSDSGSGSSKKKKSKPGVSEDASAPGDYEEGSSYGDMAQAMGGDAAPGSSLGDMFGSMGVEALSGGGAVQDLMKFAPLATLLFGGGGEVTPQHYDDHFTSYFSGGESKKVPALVSPGEVYLSPEKVRQVLEQGKNPLKIGEKFKGKAKVKNDSLKNDTIPKTLEDGGVVIPRHITTHKMGAEKAELFVHRAMMRKRGGGQS